MWLPSCLPDELLISRMIRFVTLYGWTGLHQLYQILGSEKKKHTPYNDVGSEFPCFLTP